jgi:non-ribosomal peptide synthetase component E (peptide arylation enzyme)
MVSLVSLDENARRSPDHLACVVGDDALSYAELRDASCRFAAALAGLTHCIGGGISGYDHAVCTIHVLTAT